MTRATTQTRFERPVWPRIAGHATAGVPCDACGEVIDTDDAGALVERSRGSFSFQHIGCVGGLDPATVWCEAAFATRYFAARERGIPQQRAAGIAAAATGVTGWFNQRDGVMVQGGERVALVEGKKNG